ncbi:MAG: histidine phosphatase family protein [Actinomycetota bacterium]|nr:histidine phosphatase family protein [Actinomycetota bacterium]
MTTIYLVRHGATEWNRTKRAQGQADVPLNEDGRLQALNAGESFAAMKLDAVYASDLQRARDTAQAIADRHGLEVQLDARFREIEQGHWTGLSTEIIRERWPDLWGPARHYSARPGGESPAEVRARALEGLADVVEAHPDGNVVVVSHGGTIRWLGAEALGYDDRKSARIRGLGNGQAVSIRAELVDGKLTVSDLKRLDGNTPDLDDPND